MLAWISTLYLRLIGSYGLISSVGVLHRSPLLQSSISQRAELLWAFACSGACFDRVTWWHRGKRVRSYNLAALFTEAGSKDRRIEGPKPWVVPHLSARGCCVVLVMPGLQYECDLLDLKMLLLSMTSHLSPILPAEQPSSSSSGRDSITHHIKNDARERIGESQEAATIFP